MRKTPNPFCKPCFHTLCVISFVCVQSFAQSNDTTYTQTLSRTQVTAQVRPVDAIGASAIIITPTEWEGRGQSLADLLATHAGIQTRRYGGLGSYQSVSIHGVAGNKIAICIDGVPLENDDGTAVNLGALDLNQFERIEVYKDQVPASLGGNGLGGAINLITRKNAARGGLLLASYGSHNTTEFAFHFGAALTDSSRFASSVSWRSSDNDFSYLDRKGTAYDTTDDVWHKRENAQYHEFGGSHQWSVNFPVSELRIQLAHSDEAGGIPGRESDQTKVSGFHQQWFAPRLTWLPNTLACGIRLETELGARADFDEMHWSNLLDHLGYTGAPSDFQSISTRILHGDAGLHLFSEWQKPYALEWHVASTAEQIDPSQEPADPRSWQWRLQRHTVSSNLQGSLAPLTWLGLRTNYQAEYFLDNNTGGKIHTTYPIAIPTQSETHVLQALQGLVRLGPEAGIVQVNLSAGHHYRMPSVRELFSTSLGILPNPDLQPEQGESFTGGAELHILHTRLQACAFYNQSRNEIYWVSSGNFSKPFNLGKSSTTGVETELTASPLRFVDIALHGTWQNPLDHSDSSAYRNKILPDQPKAAAGATLTLHPFQWCDLEYRIDYRSTVYSDRRNDMTLPAQATHFASIAIAPWNKGRVRFAINNITDKAYQDIYAAYPTPGRQYFLTYTQEF